MIGTSWTLFMNTNPNFENNRPRSAGAETDMQSPCNPHVGEATSALRTHTRLFAHARLGERAGVRAVKTLRSLIFALLCVLAFSLQPLAFAQTPVLFSEQNL